MKTKISILLTGILLGCALAAHSTVLRVNNTPAITVPYATFQAAYDVAVNGDTIYLEGSGYTYGILNIYKSLVIIGSGYFLNENPETQAYIYPSTVGYIYLYAGSSGTKIMGLTMSYLEFYDTGLQDFVIMRNYMYGSYTASSTYFPTNVLFEQNYIFGSFAGRFENSVFRNNYFSTMTINSLYNSLVVYNNVISNPSVTMAVCYNNIIYGTGTFTDCVLSNNVCSATQVPAGNGNQQNVNMEDVFVCYSACTGYSTDGRYQLKAGSPAIGAGSSGEDCGMFGGSFPYVLSGIPAIPAIYFFNYNFSNSTINVDMKVKSHN